MGVNMGTETSFPFFKNVHRFFKMNATEAQSHGEALCLCVSVANIFLRFLFAGERAVVLFHAGAEFGGDLVLVDQP